MYDYKLSKKLIQNAVNNISIQALYDYKNSNNAELTGTPTFQFKHCTIIRFLLENVEMGNKISIQALYDYKPSEGTTIVYEQTFQFKHCTIIRFGEGVAVHANL